MSNDIDLSVITITYNDPRGLAKTVQSLQWLQKTTLHWEHVLIDSSPTLNYEIITPLKNWPLVHKIQEPQGIYPALNQGAMLARGRVMQFLNGGDSLIESDTFVALVQEFKSNSELDLVWAGAALYRQGVYLYGKAPRPSALQNLMGFNHICHQAVLYRRQSFKKIGPFATQWKFAADYEHHYRAYLAGLKIKIVPNLIANFDMEGSSSQYKKVLKEFEGIHRSLSVALSPKVTFYNSLFLFLETLRIKFVKALASSPLSPVLRPIWQRWHRQGKTP